MNKDGKMDQKEFSIAMHLIKKKLQGYDIPLVLPQSMKMEPSISGFGPPPSSVGHAGMPSMSECYIKMVPVFSGLTATTFWQ